jgi:hypothetical protein
MDLYSFKVLQKMRRSLARPRHENKATQQTWAVQETGARKLTEG